MKIKLLTMRQLSMTVSLGNREELNFLYAFSAPQFRDQELINRFISE